MKNANAIRPLWLTSFELDERRRMRERDALVDAVGFIDHVQKGDGWRTAEVLRLQEIRALVEPNGFPLQQPQPRGSGMYGGGGTEK